MFNGYAKIVIT